MRWTRGALAIAALAACSGSGPGDADPDAGPDCTDVPGCVPVLLINEVMADNEGAWIDESLETDDWIELINVSDEIIDLSEYSIGDKDGELSSLPAEQLHPLEVILLWADDESTEGPGHLPFRLSSDGETVRVVGPDGFLHDRVAFPGLEADEAYARFGDALSKCAWSTPGEPNGETCGPRPPTELPIETEFAPFSWPTPWPSEPTGLVIAEMALNPASFIEVVNAGAMTIDLLAYELRVATTAPGLSWPTNDEGTLLEWPAASLMPGERVVIATTVEDLIDVTSTSDFEGVVTLFEGTSVIDRVDFMSWPAGASLAREGDTGRMRFCQEASPSLSDSCTPLATRPVGGRLRHLYTENDFDALAEGGVAIGIAPVKFVIDLEAGDAVHLLGASAWDLHYTFVRELIDGAPPLDRCDPSQAQEFRAGWSQFSVDNYYTVEGRRYLLGTLAHHLGPDLRTVEHSTGDQISSAQIMHGFYAAMRHVADPTRYSVRPQSVGQVNKLLTIEGQLPIVDTNEVFRDVKLQLLTEGTAYGTLEFVPAQELASHSLGPRVIVVTDHVPNDIALVGGLITEDLQTPLAHVNVLSRSRGTPNMAMVDARTDPRLQSKWGELVRLEVTPTGFSIALAEPSEAQAFWEEQASQKPVLVPSLDSSVRGLQLLEGRGIEDAASVGAKAAQLAELARVESLREACLGPLRLPTQGAAVPAVHALEHFAASGALARLAELEASTEFVADPLVRAAGLTEVRDLIEAQPVDPLVLAEVTTYVENTFGSERVRFRSSSNTEDLPEFSGAGLYTSKSAELDNPDKSIASAMRAVWASQFNMRAYDERRFANVEETSVAMGILVHRSFVGEKANIVAISRNVAEPTRGDQYTINAQFGDASVVNPAPGITSDQMIYRWGRTPRIIYGSYSNLPASGRVLDSSQVGQLTCQLRAVHDHFRPLIDPSGEDRWFAMDIEAKLEGTEQELVFKQARPYSFGTADRPADCREY